MKKVFTITLFGLALALAGCGKADPDNGEHVGPNEKVDDPEGTVQITMRNGNNGGTSLDNIYIDKADNFHIGYGGIASVGSVRGLGNVSTIPTAGWSGQVAVTPGKGYVAYDGYSDTYYRLYVMEYVESVAGGIIGAEVKYQKPFKGLDQALEPEMTKVVLDPNLTSSQQVVFKNNSIIPFKVESSEGWCQVKKASTRDQWFLYDAVVISTEDLFNAEEQTATVTITNLYGKSSTIEVTKPGRGSFIEASVQDVQFGYSDRTQWQDVGIFTNVDPADIQVSSDTDWLSGTIQSASYKPTRAVQYIDGKQTRANLENPVNRNLRIQCEGYLGMGERKGTITLTYQQAKVSINVTQAGSNFSISDTYVEFGGNDNLSKQIKYNNGGLGYNSFIVDYSGDSAEWLNVSFDRNYITVQAQGNPSEQAREATVTISYNSGDTKYELGKLNIRQKGAEYKDRKVYFQSSASNYTLVFPVAKDRKITSTADWCTATPSGGNLVIRASATTENRSATISIEGISAKIYVSQSKYKIGDDYSENGVEGKVYNMENGLGQIYHGFEQTAAWSTENVDLADAASFTDGKANTEAIKAIPGWKDLYPAFALVDGLNTNGVTGWYMPANDPLRFMKNISLKSGRYYWSSTGCGANKAYRAYCNGYQMQESPTYDSPKSDKCYVVAVHDFSYDFTK